MKPEVEIGEFAGGVNDQDAEEKGDEEPMKDEIGLLSYAVLVWRGQEHFGYYYTTIFLIRNKHKKLVAKDITMSPWSPIAGSK